MSLAPSPDKSAKSAKSAGARLLLVHAHPDDESINNGATMAKYIAKGTEVALVTCTRGEEGEVLLPEFANLSSDKDDQLGPHREIELGKALGALSGSNQLQHFFLGAPDMNYRDSGMMGMPQNDRPDVFWSASLDTAASHLVEIIRKFKPQVLITYDEFGGYGHPDHIQAHRVSMRSAELAADQNYGTSAPWNISKIYWNTIPKSVIQQGMDAMKDAASSFFGAESIDDIPFAKPDELVTSVVDATEFVSQKMEAMRAHATQIAVDGPFFALSNMLGMQVFGVEYYILAKGVVSEPFDADGRETDLFSGVSI
ncbi:MAG: N-acetyl-1-D-myo-inositol-2-amino-2-deoxy-alpha-D-glucopyranoside deacetylase [Candidatus Nanopelagicaceae bacterium]|nr:N-acetyl-1-D-myo-inositol-2-amino-2-deoxy-alpha-D-glucopyranoside deacetylase [Candidatus Nanopelagicaceae bacterium]